MRVGLFAIGSFLLVTLLASGAFGQSQRTFVSGLGSDANACSRTAPCRTLGQAISQASPGAEVVILDSAGYGSIAIAKSISIVAPPGVYAGISVFSGHGIDVNAGATDTIILRGLTVSGQGNSGSGIVFSTGGALHVENCVINGFSVGSGIQFNAAGTLAVKDSIIRSNASGILVQPFGFQATALAEIEQVRLEGNSTGVEAGLGSRISIRGSAISGSTNVGLTVVANDGSALTELDVEGCLVTNNLVGIDAAGLNTGIATARVSGSTIIHNGTGLNQRGQGLLLSRGNNTLESNTANTSGSIGSYQAK